MKVAGKRENAGSRAQRHNRRRRGRFRVKARWGCAWRPPNRSSATSSPAHRRRWLPAICRAGGSIGSKGL